MLFTRTKAERQADTITYFLHRIPFADTNPEDFFKQAALDSVSILSKIPPSLPISLKAEDSTENDHFKMAEALGSVLSPPKPPIILTVIDRINYQGWSKQHTLQLQGWKKEEENCKSIYY